MSVVTNLVLKDKITRWGLILSGIFLLLEIVSVAIFYFSLPPLVPLFNQMPWGVERLGSKNTILIPFVLGLIFLISNFFLLSRLYEKLPLLSRMVSITTLLVTLLSFYFTIRTLQLII